MSSSDPTAPDQLREQIKQVFTEMLSDPLGLPDVFRNWIPSYIEVNPPTLPIAQITGFTKFLANSTLAAASVSTSSGSYVSLSGGPTLSNLANGKYLLLYGAQANPSGGNLLYLSPSVNSAAPSDSVAANVATGGSISIMSATTSTLSNGANTVEVQYKSSGGATSQFQNRFLIALKYSDI